MSRCLCLAVISVLISNPLVFAANQQNPIPESIGIKRGICVLLGDPTGELAVELARESELLIYVELICTPGGIDGAARFEGTEGWVHVDWNSLRTYPESLIDTVIGPNEIHLYESRDHKRNFLDCIRSGQDPITPVEVGHRSGSMCPLAPVVNSMGYKPIGKGS